MVDYVKRINELEAQLNFSIIGGNKLEADNARLVALLKEWVDTPYFETFEEWAIWVSDFLPRVESAIKSQEE